MFSHASGKNLRFCLKPNYNKMHKMSCMHNYFLRYGFGKNSNLFSTKYLLTTKTDQTNLLIVSYFDFIEIQFYVFKRSNSD